MNNPDVSYKARTLNAILLVTIGYFGFNIADLFSKILQDHYSIYQVLGTSSLIGLIIASLWLKKSHGWAAFLPENYKLHILRSVFITGTAYSMVASLKFLPLADFYGIVFIMPFIVMVLAIIVLKEKVGWRRWAAAGVAFVGILIIAGPQFDNIGMGVILALAGACFGAGNIITLRKIGHNSPLPFYVVYPFILMFVVSVICILATDTFTPIRMVDVPMFLAHGPVVVFAIIFTSMGFTKAPETSIVAPFHYTQIIWGVLFGWLFFETLPTTTTWAGLSLVVMAGLYSLWREYNLSKK